MPNIVWVDRTDALAPTGSTDEAEAEVYNSLKRWLNEPQKAYGAFSPNLGIFDTSGYYDAYTLNSNITLSALSITNGQDRYVKIVGNGTNTVTLGTGFNLIVGAVGALTAGDHWFYFKTIGGEVHVKVYSV